jgi:hypothetical protein
MIPSVRVRLFLAAFPLGPQAPLLSRDSGVIALEYNGNQPVIGLFISLTETRLDLQQSIVFKAVAARGVLQKSLLSTYLKEGFAARGPD